MNILNLGVLHSEQLLFNKTIEIPLNILFLTPQFIL